MSCFIILQQGTPPNEATEEENNQPYIKDDDDEGVLNQYFIGIEQPLMMESSNVVSAVFLFIAYTYYIQWSLIITNSKGLPKFVLCNRSSY